jgi:hypothetical protein
VRIDGVNSSEPTNTPGQTDRQEDRPWYRRAGAWLQRPTTLLFFTLLLTYAYFPPTAGWNENSRFDLTMAIVDEGTLFIDSYHMNTGDKAACVGDHHCTDKAPGASFLGVLPYAVYRAYIDLRGLGGPRSRVIIDNPRRSRLKLIAPQDRVQVNLSFLAALYGVALIVAMLPGALAALLLVRLGRRVGLPEWSALAVGAIYGLGTIAFPYSTTVYGHQLATALLLGGVLVCEQVQTSAGTWPRRGRLLLAGLLVGYGFLTEYTLAVPLVGIGVYLLAALRLEALWYGLGAAPPVIGLGAYLDAAFGSPFSVGYGRLALGRFASGQSRGLYGVTRPRLDALFGTLVGRFRGLLYISPVLALAPVGWVQLWTKNAQRRLLLLSAGMVAYFVLLNSSYYMWWGGASGGPRHVLPMVPFLALPLVELLPRKRWYWRLPAVALGVLSVLNVAALTAAGFKAPEGGQDLLWQYAWPKILGWAAGPFPSTLGTVIGLSPQASLLVIVSFWVVAAALIAQQIRQGSDRR